MTLLNRALLFTNLKESSIDSHGHTVCQWQKSSKDDGVLCFLYLLF